MSNLQKDAPSFGQSELEKLAELLQEYVSILEPESRISVLQVMSLLPHLDKESALALVEEYFPYPTCPAGE